MSPEQRQTITVGINAGEMIGGQEWSTKRADIDEHGALGIADGFGVLGVQVNGRDAVRMRMCEDRTGQVVIEVTDALTGKRLGVVDVELYGLTPPRRGARPRRDRRFGDDLPR